MLKQRIWSTVMKSAVMAASIAVFLQTAPVHADAVHKVEEGDTFYLLAQKYGVKLEQLMDMNKEIEPTNIHVGMDITIPGTEPRALSVAEPAKAKTIEAAKAAISPLNILSTDKMVEAWGKTFNYSSTLQVKASAYSAAASENGKWGAVDYFGKPLKLGTIAVDPKVIPMGTKVLVTGHSHSGLPKQAFVATASDQGGAIKGRRIDIYIPGSQRTVAHFGYQDVTLYILN